ncbi:MAG TPA: hypothetical protein VGV09_00895 [Steroidobacteraceae bacterium]|nr:hypothetical protein [Steroidobacteraceae bacterium]
MTDQVTSVPDDAAARAEKRWAIVASACIAFILAVVGYTGVHWATMPPSGIEPVDPTRLHVAGEFIESNLGTQMEPDGTLVVRLIAQQYSFVPQCIVVPESTPVTFRGTSADVVHGFLITGTNSNAMLVPGYITTFKTQFSTIGDHLMPCHEFCGNGHAAMWARVSVVSKEEFLRRLRAKGGPGCV